MTLAMEQSIEAWLLRATDEQVQDGKRWYTEAYVHAHRMAMSTDGRLNVAQCAAIIAHLSPMRPWQENLKKAWEFVNTGDVVAFGAQVAGCRRAAESDDPLATFGKSAHKTRNFAKNIFGDWDGVTVDRWAVRAAGLDLDTWKGGKLNDYTEVAEAYRRVADRHDLWPAQVQAIVWCVIRGESF